jgi:hypothetical protein
MLQKSVRIAKFSLLLLSGTVFLASAVSSFSKRKEKGKGFSLDKITSAFKHQKDWEVSLEKEDLEALDSILSNDFSYLRSGSQCYAFVSQDQKYVLKFFKMNRLNPNVWLKAFTTFFNDDICDKKLHERECKVVETFSAFKTAFCDFRKNSGLLMVHLNKTDHLHRKVVVWDKSNKSWKVDLDQVPFVIQKKADLIYDRLTSLIERKEIESAKKAVLSLLNLIVERGQKGLADLDQGLRNNYGFSEELPIQIDLGRMKRSCQTVDGWAEAERIGNKVVAWVQQAYPHLAAEFQREIDHYIEYHK